MKKSRILTLLLSAAISLTPLCNISASAEESSYSFNICFITEESDEYVENVNAKLIQQTIEWIDDEHFIYVGDEVIVSEWNTNNANPFIAEGFTNNWHDYTYRVVVDELPDGYTFNSSKRVESGITGYLDGEVKVSIKLNESEIPENTTPLEGSYSLKLNVMDIVRNEMIAGLDCELFNIQTGDVVAMWNTSETEEMYIENLQYSFDKPDSYNGNITYAIRITNLPENYRFFYGKTRDQYGVSGFGLEEFANGTNLSCTIYLEDTSENAPKYTYVSAPHGNTTAVTTMTTDTEPIFTTTVTEPIDINNISLSGTYLSELNVMEAESNNEIFDAESFLVYIGTYGEEQSPIFEYYYPSNDISGTNYRHRKSYYKGSIPDDLEYGDVFVTTEDIIMTLDKNTKNTYELDISTALQRVGNCSDIMETLSLQVVDKKYNGMTMPPSYSVFTFNLCDENENEYYYSFDNFASTLGMNIAGVSEGDTLSFAVYKDSVIIPVTPEPIANKATGDVNDDGEFNISDVVLLQKWLLAIPDTHLSNWKAADFCIDDRLNILDLCLMKSQLIAKFTESTGSLFELHSVSVVQTNVDNHNEWQGYIANSGNELNEIIQENEGSTSQNITLENIDNSCFQDKSIVVIYSPFLSSNQYSIIDDIVKTEENIMISTTTKKPDIPRLDMCYRRYLYIADKSEVLNASKITFDDTSLRYGDTQEKDVVKWFNTWCES